MADRRTYHELCEMIATLTAKLTATDDWKAAADRLAVQVEQLDDALAAAEEQAEKLSAHNKTLAKQFALMGKVRAERTALRAEVETLRGRVGATEELEHKLRNRIEKQQAQLTAAEKRAEKAEQESVGYQSRLARVGRDRDALHAENKTLRERAEAAEAEAEHFAERSDGARAALDDLRIEHETLRRERVDHTDCAEEIVTLRDKLAEVQGRVRDEREKFLHAEEQKVNEYNDRLDAVNKLVECERKRDWALTAATEAAQERDEANAAKEKAEARICRDPCCPTLHKEYERGYNDANALVNTQAKMLGKERDARDAANAQVRGLTEMLKWLRASNGTCGVTLLPGVVEKLNAALANAPEPQPCEGCTGYRTILSVLALWSGNDDPHCADVVAMQDYASAALEQQPPEGQEEKDDGLLRHDGITRVPCGNCGGWVDHPNENERCAGVAGCVGAALEQQPPEER